MHVDLRTYAESFHLVTPAPRLPSMRNPGYLVGDVVNPQLRSFACANSALVIGASERLDQAEGELDRFRRRPAAKLENPACAFLRILHAEDCSGDAIRVQDRNLLC